MKKILLFAALAGATQLGPGCKHDADVRPSEYDVLAQATGHWEWESTGYQSGLRTPASVGFTRQVIFGAGGQLTVRRGGQADYRASYRLSRGPSCAGLPGNDVPLVVFPNEKDLPNNDEKSYSIAQQNGRQDLYLVGVGACFDGGAFETYHWIAE